MIPTCWSQGFPCRQLDSWWKPGWDARKDVSLMQRQGRRAACARRRVEKSLLIQMRAQNTPRHGPLLSIGVGAGVGCKGSGAILLCRLDSWPSHAGQARKPSPTECSKSSTIPSRGTADHTYHRAVSAPNCVQAWV